MDQYCSQDCMSFYQQRIGIFFKTHLFFKIYFSEAEVIVVVEILFNSCLVSVHFHNLLVIGAIFWLFISSIANESRKPQRNALVLLVAEAGCVHRAEGEVSCFDFPDVPGLEVHITLDLWQVVLDFNSRGRGFQRQILELIRNFSEFLIRKASADLAN